LEKIELEFNRLMIGHIKPLRPFFEANKCRICDCTVGGTFIWRDYHKTEFAIADDVLFLKVAHPIPAFAPPRGRSVTRGAYERIIEYCAGSGKPARLCAVSGAVLETILKLYPNAKAWTDRDWSDYLYLSDDLVKLEGRRYSGQRNHINRFTREHQAWSFDCITPENMSGARAYIEKFAREFDKDRAVYMEGNRKSLEILDNLELYRQIGGVLSVAGEVIGVSIGEIMDDTLYIHAEKADTGYHGSYPMLMHQFARKFATAGITYINREEDDGVEGLRTSKTSYHPVEMLDKYIVELN